MNKSHIVGSDLITDKNSFYVTLYKYGCSCSTWMSLSQWCRLTECSTVSLFVCICKITSMDLLAWFFFVKTCCCCCFWPLYIFMLFLTTAPIICVIYFTLQLAGEDCRLWTMVLAQSLRVTQTLTRNSPRMGELHRSACVNNWYVNVSLIFVDSCLFETDSMNQDCQHVTV